jgi:hypothetical protein
MGLKTASEVWSLESGVWALVAVCGGVVVVVSLTSSSSSSPLLKNF